MCLVRVSSASAAVMSLLIAKLELHLEFAKADVAIPPAGLQVLAKPNTVFRNEQLLSKLLLFLSFTQSFCAHLCTCANRRYIVLCYEVDLLRAAALL